MNIDRNELDGYITGNYGEDQPHDEDDESEFYGPWRVVKLLRMGSVADMAYVIYDDNGNPMCYAEDDFFMVEAVKRINVYEAMLALAQEIAKDYPDAADWKDARSKLSSMANDIMQKVR